MFPLVHESQWKFSLAKDIVSNMSGPHPGFGLTAFCTFFLWVATEHVWEPYYFLRAENTFQTLLVDYMFSYFFKSFNFDIKKISWKL